MARRNRATLKDYFRYGRRPSEQAFEDLIDSGLNTLDDGFFTHSPEIGIGLVSQGEHGALISTFVNPGDDHPVWEIAIDRNSKDLVIRNKDGHKGAKTSITLKHSDDPAGGFRRGDVLVSGNLHAQGRVGAFKRGKVPADGHWHDILDQETVDMEGCWMFEVTAGCAQRDKGRYAILHAVAMHCFGNRRKIRKSRSNFGIFGNRICIRWLREKGTFKCRLQLKTMFRYDGNREINYQVANLWDNPTMNDLI